MGRWPTRVYENRGVTPAQAGVHSAKWIPACAGMTSMERFSGEPQATRNLALP